MNKMLTLSNMGISTSENLSTDVKKVIRKIGKINNELADLGDQEDQDTQELKDIKAEIKAKCAKLFDRQKQLKLERKKRNEQRLLLMGERHAYKKELAELGVATKKTLPTVKHSKELEAIEVES